MAPAKQHAALLGLLLLSCSTTRHTASPEVEELARYVLVIEESAGQVTHRWQHAEDSEISRYKRPSSHPEAARATRGRVVLASGGQRDCHAEFYECIDKCMDRPLPRGFGHVTSGGRGKGGKEQWCREQCWQPYLDCEELQGRRPQEFSVADEAVGWMKRNPEAVLVGGIIIIAGVAFVVVSAGVGLVILVPAVLLAS